MTMSKEEIQAKADRAEARSRGQATAEEFVKIAFTEGELAAEVKKLAALPIGVFETVRKPEAKRLGMRASVLELLVRAERAKTGKEQKDFLPHWRVEPWSESVDGVSLLEGLRKHFLRYVVLPKHTDVLLGLWTLHTWVFDCFDITPYLAITSPTRRCGKTLLMTMLYWLCCRAKKNDSMSKAAIYRSVERDKPTLCLDEVGWVVDLRDDRQDILCGGFERLGHAEVCEGEGADLAPRLFSTFCPKAFGLIGKLTATLMDRSIEIAMQRKLNEKVERLRRRDNDDHARFRQQCLRWADDNRDALATIAVEAPEGLNDRAFDIWEPLFVIAEHVGGEWPNLASEAAIALSGGESASEEKGIELLIDIKRIFETGEEEITTKALVAALCGDEERPWATWNKGKPISDRQVAKLLRQFPIVSEDVYPAGEKHAKGYKKIRFLDAFERYLTPQNHACAQPGGKQACERVNADETGTSSDFSIRVESDLHGCKNGEKPANDGALHAYTDKYPPLARDIIMAAIEPPLTRTSLPSSIGVARSVPTAASHAAASLGITMASRFGCTNAVSTPGSTPIGQARTAQRPPSAHRCERTGPMRRRFLLPANLDREAMNDELSGLVRKHARRGLVVTGWTENRYPGERGWVDQPGNPDPKRRIWYAFIHTRRKQPGEVV